MFASNLVESHQGSCDVGSLQYPGPRFNLKVHCHILQHDFNVLVSFDPYRGPSGGRQCQQTPNRVKVLIEKAPVNGFD
jgi:hypothetical protein